MLTQQAGSDAKVLPNSAGEEEYVSQPGSAASGEDNDEEEEEEEVPAVPMLAPARLASRRLKGFVESRYLTAKELENLDLATANRVPEGFMQVS